jgi:hypothetical protein
LLTTGAAAAALPLEYSAPAGCPDRAAFLREVSARLPRSAGEAKAVRVVIQPVAGEFFARMEVTDPRGTIAEREINGSRCDQVSSAMALVVALVLTELGQQKQTLPSPLPEGETNATLSALPAQPAAGASPPPAASTPAERPAFELFPGPDAARATAPSDRSIPFETGLLATASGGIAPVPAGGAGSTSKSGTLRSRRRVSASGRALPCRSRVTPEPPASTGSEGGSTVAGRCWRMPAKAASQVVRVSRPQHCAAMEIESTNPYSTVDPWLALGLLARPGWRAGAFVLQAELGPTFPLMRRTYVFGTQTAPEAKIYEQPPVSFHFGVGAGVRL